VFNTINNVMDFLWDFRCSVRRRDDDTLAILASRGLVIYSRKLLSLDMTKAAHIAAARTNDQMDARASDCTLDQLDEEG
jgi:GTP cyclohydrolase II